MRNSIRDNYRIYTRPAEAHKALNSLKGIIEGIFLDSQINTKELIELEKWCDKHEFLTTSNPFNEILTNVQVIISDNVVTENEIKDMLWLCNNFKEGFNYYDENVSGIQILQGIFHGILADGQLRDKEIFGLKNWIDANSSLA